MSECLTNFAADPNIRSIVNKKIIASLITDNYTILIVFIALAIFIVAIAFYFINHMRTVLKDYNKYNRKLELAPPPTNNQYDVGADDERYEKEDAKEKGDIGLYKMQFKDEPMDYVPKGKKDFLEDVKTKYDDYNVLKSQYIKTTYKKNNDDVIDNNILFSKYDDYEYTKKPENDDY